MDDQADDPIGPDDIEMQFINGEAVDYWITTSPSITHEERAQLEHEINAPSEGVKIQQYGAGPGATEIALAISILANVATTAQATASVFEKLSKWIQSRRQHGKPVDGIYIERTIIIREKVEIRGDNVEDLKRFFMGGKTDVE